MSRNLKLHGRTAAGQSAIVDDALFESIKSIRWHLLPTGYVYNKTRIRGNVYLHRFVLTAKKGEQVDHINANRLDNRRRNLRICSQTVNLLNTNNKRRKSSGRYRGVRWDKRRNRWIAEIRALGKHYHIGYFRDEEKAAAAYQAKNAQLVKELIAA